jgi:hypothetical protein
LAFILFVGGAARSAIASRLHGTSALPLAFGREFFLRPAAHLGPLL